MKHSGEALRCFSTAAAVLAAMGAVLVGFASPRHHFPMVAVGLSTVLALGAGMIGPWGLLRALVAVPLVPLLVLCGVLAGLLAMDREFDSRWIMLLSNGQLLRSWEVFLRCLTAFAAIAVLAGFSTSRQVARGLLVLAVSGPGLLLVYYVRGRAAIGGLDVGAWSVCGALLGGSLVLTVAWIVVARRCQLLERAHQFIGREILKKVLALAKPDVVSKAIDVLDGWVDPTGRLAAQVRTLVAVTDGGSRQAAFSQCLDGLRRDGGVWPRECRRQLQIARQKKPEVGLLLAEDRFTRGLAAEGLAETAAAVAGAAADCAWLAETALAAWDQHSAHNAGDVQRLLWRESRVVATGTSQALATLAMLVLEQGLSPELSAEFANIPPH